MHTDEVLCPTCKGRVATRINRTGFLQKHVFSRFGLYPWKCGACGASFLYRHRGHASRLSRHGRVIEGDRNHP
jgi:hypothetical protein